MITAAVAFLLLLAALVPLAWAARRGRAGRDRREAAVGLHREQLAELDRDLAEGRIHASEHAAATLEVQRRLLSAADLRSDELHAGARAPLVAVLFVVPLLATALYLVRGKPGMPAMPAASRVASGEAQGAQDERLLVEMRQRLAGLDQTTDMARQGWLLLGGVEDRRGNLPAAVDAWGHALAIKFDPELAALTAEARTLIAGGAVDKTSADLFARALEEGPAGAPWRATAEQRLRERGMP